MRLKSKITLFIINYCELNLLDLSTSLSLSEYSDENMMDAYNLAICFGPTLMPAPEEKDQVQCQNQVNDLIKNMIVFHEDLFPKDLGGTIYEKYISQEPFDCDVGDSPTEQVTEDPDSEVYPSEDGKLIAILNLNCFFTGRKLKFIQDPYSRKEFVTFPRQKY